MSLVFYSCNRGNGSWSSELHIVKPICVVSSPKKLIALFQYIYFKFLPCQPFMLLKRSHHPRGVTNNPFATSVFIRHWEKSRKKGPSL